ncbi:Protoporphyrinogen oxidase [Catalinimonas alkaloidigena]|uniref:Protoporphyrinogen oxidase n=1 Tax=Catalinimonas alkaloidigena TaxID=1075417 RepID=A0A1G9LE27_9BACT|nr:FAD-dependent oxidoreductase [Catalinimonas alkaloidigena]SDL60023.1 Protoporphyrinogen oxidase [Catalinimonas alkaloidigena]
MKNIAVIGGGISGISVARMLQSKHTVTVFERESSIGGLIKCERVDGNLYHKVGGHVFNSKNPDVTRWFWQHFDQETEFVKARRKAGILFGDFTVDYPIENHLYQLPEEWGRQVLQELVTINRQEKKAPFEYAHFEEFLRANFGQTLYRLYFEPYNKKIWRFDLNKVAMDWLEGKLPMPELNEILMANIFRAEESEMVHSTFFYAKNGGSQFIIDRLAQGLQIETNFNVTQIRKEQAKFVINEYAALFDCVIFCGDVRQLSTMYVSSVPGLEEAFASVAPLRSNGTSNVFCECDPSPWSWLYLPDPTLKAHRIIYTGNLSETNNAGTERLTCVVEFSGKHSNEEMQRELKRLPGNLHPLAYNYEPNSYVIQEKGTRQAIESVKSTCEAAGLFLLGRFAEWEYYNMDKAMEAAMDLAEAHFGVNHI